MKNIKKYNLDSHPNLINADKYLQKQMTNLEFKQRYEEEGLKIQIAQTIYKQRKTLKMSQTKLAQKAKTTQRMISQIERADMSVGVDLLQRIVHALGAKISLKIS